jgi:hypothetical protein
MVYLLVVGLAFLACASIFGALAIRQAATASAYRHAAACPSSAAFDADCVQTVGGSVTGVEEVGGNDAQYELDVQAGSRALDISFPFDDQMLSYAADGDPAEVTVWRGIPVSVTANGYSATPSSLPGYAAATDLGHFMECFGVSLLILLAPLGQWRMSRTGRWVLGPLGVALLIASVLIALIISASGLLLTQNPDEPATTFIIAAVAVAVALALAAWAGAAIKRRQRKRPEFAALRHPLPAPPRIHRSSPSPQPRPRPAVPLRVRLRYRLRPSGWLPVLRTLLKSFLPPALLILVLSGLFVTMNDAPNARAFQSAPACQGETNLSVCVGEFTATVNGVRTSSPSADTASISYATADGAINAWGDFAGSAEALAGTAQAEQTAGAPVRIEAWRGAIVGAEIGGSWHWATGNPPGDTPPAIFLAVSLTLLLLLIRYRAHHPTATFTFADTDTDTDAYLAARAGTTRRALLRDDLGEVAASAAGYVLLIYGYWYGALPILAALGWMGWTAWRNARIRAGR